jgi:hypothetical protein
VAASPAKAEHLHSASVFGVSPIFPSGLGESFPAMRPRMNNFTIKVVST